MTTPMDEFVEIAERSIIRFEAEQVITGCLTQGDPAPFEELIQGLVINGPTALLALREILDAVRTFKAELSQEGLEIREDLMEALGDFGVFFPQLMAVETSDLFRQICSFSLAAPEFQAAGPFESQDEELLTEISGLAYEAAHTDWSRPETLQ